MLTTADDDIELEAYHVCWPNEQILDQIDSPDRGATLLWSKAIAHPGVMEWLRLKAAMCVDLIQDWRATVVSLAPLLRF